MTQSGESVSGLARGLTPFRIASYIYSGIITYQALQIEIISPTLSISPLINRVPSGPNEVQTFDVEMIGSLVFGGNPIAPISATGSAQSVAFGKFGQATGSFQTEMLSMSISGMSPLGPFMIRESPTLSSLGMTSVEDIGGGLYQIESFFDLYTELSVDGGMTWLLSDGAAGFDLLSASVPEPSSIVLCGFGGLAFTAFRRFRAKSASSVLAV